MSVFLRRDQSRALLILIVFWAIGFGYSMAVPAFETPDELYHYGFARHVAQGNGLPVQGDPEEETPWEHEGSQAPLYYLTVGLATAAIDQSDFEAMRVRNPRANIGDPLFPGNKNFMLYSAATRPLHGVNLALHVGRWISLLLAGATLWLVYATARLALPAAPMAALIAMATVAAIPQFIFISASLSNDNMVTLWSVATVYWLARLLTLPLEKAIAPWRWGVLGLLLGLAALSKLSGLGLVGLTGVVAVGIAWRRRDWLLPLRALAPTVLPLLGVAGWWYWRNVQLYGTLLGVDALLSVNGYRDDGLTWQALVGEFRGLRYSFWGIFGWFNILLPGWVYPLLDLVSLMALAGLLGGVLRSARSPATAARWILAMLALWLAMLLGLIGYWATFATSSQGRLLFPGLSAIGILVTCGLYGWTHLISRRWRLPLLCSLPLFLALCSLYTLGVLIPRSYVQPRPQANVAADATPVDVLYGDADTLELLALELPPARYTLGDDVPIGLYMTAEQRPSADYQLFVQLLDEKGDEIGNVTTHPGWGRNPTSLWSAGAIYLDRYPVRIERDIDNRSPLLADLYIGFVNPLKEQQGKLPVTARNRTGVEITPFLAQIPIAPATWPTREEYGLTTANVSFADGIELIGYRHPQAIAAVDGISTTAPLTVTIMYAAADVPATEQTAYVHLLDGAGVRVAGYDRAPAANRYPTSAWQRGDRIVADFVLDVTSKLPTGEYQLWTGLYESASAGAQRLTVLQADRLETRDNQVRLGQVRLGAVSVP